MVFDDFSLDTVPQPLFGLKDRYPSFLHRVFELKIIEIVREMRILGSTTESHAMLTATSLPSLAIAIIAIAIQEERQALTLPSTRNSTKQRFPKPRNPEPQIPNTPTRSVPNSESTSDRWILLRKSHPFDSRLVKVQL